ncbi:hypothetical protein BDZ89DRAFT_1019740 [Hymenopellis radicata]|nr:hypothetical protein BDZ89DRAFT_1019740 [Hymenopellis radicata]
MSSNEEDNDESHNKKRRIQRACDVCRRKKIRCDGVHTTGNRCSNCVAYNFDCTYVEAAKKRGPPKGYVESLENRIEKMDQLLQRLMPEADFTKELGSRFTKFAKDTWAIEPPSNNNVQDVMRSLAGQTKEKCLPKHGREGTYKYNSAEEKLLEDEFQHLTLVDNLNMHKVATDGNGYRFFGKSSGAQLIKTALDLKNSYTGAPSDSRHRPEFWSLPSWENRDGIFEGVFPSYSFPEEDLMNSLIDLYFQNVNIFLPLLHRPTFERSLSEGLHHKDDMFAAVILLVCACASRYSDDDRVLLDGEESRHSSGWKWFDQVQLIRKSVLLPPTLYDLQVYVLCTEFLAGSSAPQASWTMVGVGIRLAQDVGAHRRKRDSASDTVESELWKRAFWILVIMDRASSSALGRPCAILDEDIDIDFPAECDDEYWEHPDPEQAFKQPPGKPSYIAYFNTYLRLNQLLSFCLRTVYSLNKSKILLGFAGQQWEQTIVAELDSALNRWIDAIPDHLRWDPSRENTLFFNQSAHLYISYYHLQILIHRPFIPTPKIPSPLSFPSLAICTNAARSCSHVIDIQSKRSFVIPSIGMSAFTAGIVLLFNIWGGQRSGLSIDPHKEMGDVHKCMKMLHNMETRWHIAGRLWDILYELASVGDLPLPNASPGPNNKRDRDSDSPLAASESSPETGISMADKILPRTMAGTRRVASRQEMQVSRKLPTASGQPPPIIPPTLPNNNLLASTQQAPQSFALPMYSNELGRMPLHGQFTFTSHPHLSSQPQQPIGASVQTSWFGNVSAPVQQPPAPQQQQQDFLFMNAPFFGMPSSTNTGFSGPSYEYGDAMGMSGVRAPAAPPMMPMNDTISMWSSAPSGFELEDWGTYLTNVSEMTHL